MQRSLQLQMRKPSIETMGTVDCQQGMEGWYDAAVCGLVREVVGVYSVSSIMCVPEIGIRPLETQGGSGLLFFMFVHTPRPGAPAQPPYQLDAPYTWSKLKLQTPIRVIGRYGDRTQCPVRPRGSPAECGTERQPSSSSLFDSSVPLCERARLSPVSPCSLLVLAGGRMVQSRIPH